MGLLTHGIAVGLGYLLGRPEGRQRLAEAGKQAAELRNRPEVTRLTERGKGVAVEQAQAVKDKVKARVRPTHFPPSQDTPAPTSLGGTTVAEDSEAAVLGTTAPGTTAPGTTTPGTTSTGTTTAGTTTPGTTSTGTNSTLRTESAQPLREKP